MGSGQCRTRRGFACCVLATDLPLISAVILYCISLNFSPQITHLKDVFVTLDNSDVWFDNPKSN